MVIPVLMISAVGTTFVEANQIGAFSNFVITTSYERTGYLTKENEDAEYIMNLNPCRNLHPMTVKHRIVNSNGEARSGESVVLVQLMGIGQRLAMFMQQIWQDKIGGIYQLPFQVVGHQTNS